MCWAKISWTGRPVDPLVLDGHLPGHDHADDRLAATAAGAAGAVQEDVAAAGGDHVFAEFVGHVVGPGGLLARGRAHLDADPAAGQAGLERFLGLGGQGGELLRDLRGHNASCTASGTGKWESADLRGGAFSPHYCTNRPADKRSRQAPSERRRAPGSVGRAKW